MKLTLEFAEDGDATWKNSRGEIVARWNKWDHIDYPEDLTADRDIGVLVAEVYEKGYRDGQYEGKSENARFREALEKFESGSYCFLYECNCTGSVELIARAALEGKL